jgi:hypothetical protein
LSSEDRRTLRPKILQRYVCRPQLGNARAYVALFSETLERCVCRPQLRNARAHVALSPCWLSSCPLPAELAIG